MHYFFLLGNVFRENKDKLTVSHFIKVMEMQNIQLLELLTPPLLLLLVLTILYELTGH
jgi:hypothetical protein